MQLEIRLLGTVEVLTDGRVTTPGAAKRKAILAGLALEANRSLSLNQIAEMTWAEDRPASAVANIRSHAAALRRIVGDRLVARTNAYELRLAPHELDVAEFQRLAAEGLSGRTTGDPGQVLERLTAALACWRGPAGDDLPRGTALDNRWASLDEQRLHVFEQLTDARLSVGQHGQLLPELRRHLAAHPLRERAWAQLMLALYRCGDVTGALSAYRDAHDVLSEQLGLDPGEELATLHRAMLDREPELHYEAPNAPVGTTRTSAVPVGTTDPQAVSAGTPDAAATGDPTEPGPVGSAGPQAARVDAALSVGPLVPRELPADLAGFVGRTREVAAVVAAVTAAAPAAVVVAGAVGSGKSALVVRAAHAVADEFPDGQVFVDLAQRPGITPHAMLGRVLRALGVPPADLPEHLDERAGRLRSLLAARRVLIVVDGVTHHAQVRPLIPAGPGSALIVAGQRRLHSLDGVRRVVVGPLGAADAHRLLAGFAGPERLAADPADTAGLIRVCAGSPLALRIVGSRLAGCPGLTLRDLTGQLVDSRRRLDWLAHGDLSVRDRLAAGYAAVCAGDDVAGRLLEVLGSSTQAAALPERAAAQLGVSTHRLRLALENLVDAHLVVRDESDRYRLPALIREFAAELPTRPAGLPASHAHPLTGWRVEPLAA
ncbi:AfsR/SARP family transcriptional regulator [Micromonospora siamensis]|uniref:DNA-binding transcriptional activator of the SARP family n=1 Tax=Micromonospora siamensis TaxID=299152 RepID=A0A1C5J9C7_9ACTN|nr:AfsR/SARP family transcriptional regulator [Micromonospora siamensis]SCG67175.1 DNA-binding transcriptional activator of the SARP family [Micromonospora siamensis]